MTGERWLVTGFPALRARKLVELALDSLPELELSILVHPQRLVEAGAALERFGSAAERCQLVEGKAGAIDFGLSGPNYLGLARTVTRVHHLYQSFEHGLSDREARAVNVAATREIIEFAKAAGALRRLVHYSSVFVSGNRSGIVLEDELNRGQSFRAPFEESLALSEAMLEHVHDTVPLTIVRSAQVIGDSRTGEVDRLAGPYPLIVYLVSSADQVALPLPPRADTALHLVPVDFVARAGIALGLSEAARGKTVHLVDPRPVSGRRFVELVADLCGKRLAGGLAPTPLTQTFRNPGVRLVANHLRSLQNLLSTPVSYDDRQAMALLAGTGIDCPALDAYLPAMVEHVKARAREGKLFNDQPEEGPFLVD